MSRERRREWWTPSIRPYPPFGSALLGTSRSSVYNRPRAPSRQDLSFMKQIDQRYLIAKLLTPAQTVFSRSVF